jgi:hypothetical protein
MKMFHTHAIRLVILLVALCLCETTAGRNATWAHKVPSYNATHGVETARFLQPTRPTTYAEFPDICPYNLVAFSRETTDPAAVAMRACGVRLTPVSGFSSFADCNDYRSTCKDGRTISYALPFSSRGDPQWVMATGVNPATDSVTWRFDLRQTKPSLKSKRYVWVEVPTRLGVLGVSLTRNVDSCVNVYASVEFTNAATGEELDCYAVVGARCRVGTSPKETASATIRSLALTNVDPSPTASFCRPAGTPGDWILSAGWCV